MDPIPPYHFGKRRMELVQNEELVQTQEPKYESFMIEDRDDGYYDVYIFEKGITKQSISEIIKAVKIVLIGEWTLADIEEAIKKNLSPKEIHHFGAGEVNMIDVND